MTERERRELDAQVAGKVMGWTNVMVVGYGDWWGFMPEQEEPGMMIPDYSSELASAWKVVEKLRGAGWLVVVKEMPDGFHYLGPGDMDPQPKVYRRACCSLSWMPRQTEADTRRGIFLHPFAMGDTVMEAICKCALLAVAELARYS
jgi:hypothetical protein